MHIIRTNGNVEEFTFKTDNHLKELQDVVGGYIERLKTEGGNIIVINEEGKLLGLPVNDKASELYNNPQDNIVGDVLIGKDSEIFTKEP